MTRAAAVGAIFAAFGSLAFAPRFFDDYLVGFMFTLMMWLALTQSWALFSGLTGYVSLGHAVFFGIGAYAMVLCWGAVSLWAALAIAGAAAGLLALIAGYPCLRVRGPYFVILTFGLAELVKYVVVNVEAALGQFSRVVFAAPDLDLLYYAMVVLAAVSTAVTYAARRSRVGVGLRAIREDEQAAETLGVDVTAYKTFAFCASAVVPGMVGAVAVLRTTYFEPLQAFSPVTSFMIVAIAIFGGGDDAPGPVYGAVFLVVLQELLWANWPEVYMIILGTLLIVFVLWSPDGVHGWVRRFRRRR